MLRTSKSKRKESQRHSTACLELPDGYYFSSGIECRASVLPKMRLHLHVTKYKYGS